MLHLIGIGLACQPEGNKKLLLNEYATEWLHKFKDYITEKKLEPTTYRCCISLVHNEISLLYVNKTLDTIELVLSEIFHFDNLDSLHLVLIGIAKKYPLENVPIYWLLSPNDYQLLVINNLPVPKEEFDAALGWRVRNLLSYPINEAVIDSFIIPPNKTPDSGTIGVVVARMKPLTNILNLLESINLNLTVIDIPELAMRNLSALHEDDEKATAFIYFFENIVILNITCQKILYFTRRINFSSKDQTEAEDYEKLSLEILRYFDYFQSQWRYPTPGRIFVGAYNKVSEDMAVPLAKYLMLPVEKYSLNNLFLNKEKINLLEKKYLLKVGCVIREENKE